MQLNRRKFFGMTAGSLALPSVLSLDACSTIDLQLPDTDITHPEINPHPRDQLQMGGSLSTYFDQAMLANWNYYHIDGNFESVYHLCAAIAPMPMKEDYRCVSTPNYDYLAEAPREEIIHGKQTITYTLKPGLKYTDGTPVSWRDYKTIFEMNCGKHPQANATLITGYDRIESVERGVNDQQVVITFAKKYGDWRCLFPILYPYWCIDTVKKFNTGWLTKIPPSCGPFKVDSLDLHREIVSLVRDPQWINEPAMLDRINFFIMDTTTSVQAFKNGTLDAVPVQTQSDLATLDDMPGIRIPKSLNSKFYYLGFNANPERLTHELGVRQAIQKAVDVAFIRKSLIGDFNRSIPPLGNHIYLVAQAGYQDNSIRYDPAAAEAQLDSLGWKRGFGGIRHRDGVKLTLGILTRSDGFREKLMAEMVQANLLSIGIQAILQAVPSVNFFPDYFLRGVFDLAISDWVITPGPISSNYSIYALYYKEDPQTHKMVVDMTLNNQNCGIVGNDYINHLFELAMAESDPEKQTNLGNKIDKAIWQEGHSLPLLQLIEGMAQKENLANYGEILYGEFRWQDIGYVKSPQKRS